MEELTDIARFLMERKKWWLYPIIIVMLVLGALIVLGESTSLSPFVYSLF